MLNSIKPNKKIVYTAITNNYELHPIINSQPGWDYVCFSDTDIVCDGWTNKRIENEYLFENKIKTSKLFKIMPHLFFLNYDISIWIDSSLQFKENINLDMLCADFQSSDTLFKTRTHPYRQCIYREMEEVLNCRLDTNENVNRIMEEYRKQNFPENFGLAETCFVLRKHNDKRLITFAEEWWANVRDNSQRDQLSFNYVLWKNPIDIELIDDRVAPYIERASYGYGRGPFFTAIFNYYPTH